MIIALSRFIRGFSLSRRSVSPTPEMPPFSRFCDRRRGNRRGAASFADRKSRARSGPNLPFCPRPSASVHSPVLRSSAFVRPGLVALFVAAAAAVGVEFGVVVDASNRVRASSNGQLPEPDGVRTRTDEGGRRRRDSPRSSIRPSDARVVLCVRDAILHRLV